MYRAMYQVSLYLTHKKGHPCTKKQSNGDAAGLCVDELGFFFCNFLRVGIESSTSRVSLLVMNRREARTRIGQVR